MEYPTAPAPPPALPLDGDTELMLRVGQGDAASFATLLSRHRPAIVHFIFLKVRNLAVAEELSQEVFLRVFRARQSYQPTAKFRTWLFRIATNLALNAIRDARKEAWHARLSELPSSGRLLQISDGRPTAEQRMLRDTEYHAVRQAISELPHLQRSAVTMQRYRDMDYAEIARTLGCSEPAVKSLLFRAHETLRRRLEFMTVAARAAASPELLDRIAS